MTLIEWYLCESGGDFNKYVTGLSREERIGQAFYNALTPADRLMLVDSGVDPFYSKKISDVEKAIDYLTTTSQINIRDFVGDDNGY